MIVDKYGRVGGSIDFAQVAELLAQTEDEDLKAHYLEVLGEQVTPAAEDVLVQTEEPALEPEPAPEVAEPTKPAAADPKAAWVDWAVSLGADRDEAEATTKADLIAAYGSEG